MNYTPVVVTQANAAWAINENIRLIYAALATKVKFDVRDGPGDLNAGGFRIRRAASALTKSLDSPITLADAEALT